MTTDDADEANQLADDCNQGGWGMAASAPDFCFTRYW